MSGMYTKWLQAKKLTWLISMRMSTVAAADFSGGKTSVVLSTVRRIVPAAAKESTVSACSVTFPIVDGTICLTKHHWTWATQSLASHYLHIIPNLLARTDLCMVLHGLASRYEILTCL
jgi:hypothetical protein